MKSNQEVRFTLNAEVTKKDIIMQFNNKGLVSPYDIFESPDARKLGILLNSIEFK